MILKELINILEVELEKGDRPISNGLQNPHSYRGYYEELSFEVKPSTILETLKVAKSALNKEFRGWKGGYFKMTENTPCWISDEGYLGRPLEIHLLMSMLN